jgi:anaerobic magnesium-protoporphyrin IX monomethyl ester cyclase
MEIERATLEEFYDYCRASRADMILFVVTGQNPNASSAAMSGATKAAQYIYDNLRSGKIGFVGPHVNALPIETMKKHDFIDVAFTNEGVYALKNIASRGVSIEALKTINGIAYRDGTDIIMNDPERIVPQDKLEIDLPGVAYDLMPPLSKYRTSNWHTNFRGGTSPFASIYTSLGCFAKCNFCMINIINRTSNENLASNSFNVFRYWSPEFTIKQMEYLAEQGVTNLKIADEMFVYRPAHFMELCKLIIERGLKFNIWAYSRVDTAKPHYLETLKAAGVNHLALGIESASQTVRQEIDKGRFKEINIRDLIGSINDHGIGVGGNFIFGLPTDTYETMQQTADLAYDLELANMNVYCSTALPGSPLYLEAKLKGRQLPTEYSEFGFLSYDHIPDSTDSLSSRDVLAFRDKFFHDYFTNQNTLLTVKRKYGQSAVDNINKMTSIKLKRKLLE